MICVLIAATLTGCALSSLSASELREFRNLDAEVVDICKRAEPREAPTSSLKPRLDRMIELMGSAPHHMHDSDPTNDEGQSDGSTPALDLVYIAGLLHGTEGLPACNKKQAGRVDAAVEAAWD